MTGGAIWWRPYIHTNPVDLVYQIEWKPLRLQEKKQFCEKCNNYIATTVIGCANWQTACDGRVQRSIVYTFEINPQMVWEE